MEGRNKKSWICSCTSETGKRHCYTMRMKSEVMSKLVKFEFHYFLKQVNFVDATPCLDERTTVTFGCQNELCIFTSKNLFV